jgi:hypothetical protein
MTNKASLFIQFTTDSISLYSDLKLTISYTAAYAITVTTITTNNTFLFTTAVTFWGEVNH